MKIPQHLKHHPVIVLEDYHLIDGPNAGPDTSTDAQGLSLGLAQWNDRKNIEISAKVWRYTGVKWSRQSEELHTWFVEAEYEPPTLPAPQPGPVDIKIGDHIADLVEDGSTIQLGIGGIPNAAALALRGKKELGVHTEMFVDAMMELYEQGVITNRRKAFRKNKSICTFSMGSRKLYDWLDGNVSVDFQRGSWVNDPAVIAQNSKMVSINTCLMVDLTGQVSSESIGPRQYSGTGGQSDTAQGATGGFDGQGKSIIACYATAKEGTVSTIVPVLPEGSAVTLHRSFVDHVVTEHGVARLRGRTVRERVAELISVAAPEFREDLKAQARKLDYI